MAARFDTAVRMLNIDPGLAKYLRTTERDIIIHIPVQMDSGKLAVFDGSRGMIAMLDPVITKPAWTTVVFDHAGLGEAMKGLFEDYWGRSKRL